MSDNYSNKIYFLETDKTHTIEQFKIVNYCSIEKLFFEQSDNKTDFPKKGKLVIDIKNVYDIHDMQSLIKNDFTEFNHSTDKKLYIVHEDSEQQYLYYTTEYNYKISDKKIQIKDCFQTKFDKLTTKDANTDFIQRVTEIQKKLEELAKHIDNTRESLSKAQKTQDQQGGAESIEFTDLNLGKNKGDNNPQQIEGRFNSMIRSYIDNVNEIANYSFFKKLFSLSEDDINDESIDDKDKFGFSDSIKQRIYEFKYVCVNYQSIPDGENKSYDELSDKLKFLLLGLDYTKGNDIPNAIKNSDNSKQDYLIKGDQIDENSFQAKFLKEKYNDYDYDTSVKYKVGHFANNILEPIYKSKLNLSNINENDKEFKNDIARFLFFILGIIEYEYKYLRQLFYTSFEGEENTNSDLIEKFNDETMHKKLDNRIQTNINNSILTYLKIRNDYHQEGSGETDLSEQSYNRRFEIKFPKYSEGDNKQILLLNYNNDNETYYEKDDRNMYIPIEHEKEEQKTDIENLQTDKIDSINYPYSYLFGKYNNIFEPKQDNSTVANQITEVIDAMNKNKTVFVIGYGASGAGKTSTLISRRMPNGDIQDGILIELCKRYCENISNNNKITVNVHSCEIYQDANQENQEPTINYTGNWNKDNSKQPVNFDYNNSSFKLSSPIQHENFHPFRVNKQSDNECNFNEPKEFGIDTQLSDYLRYIIDTDRHVKATPNNINSSRSHALVFIGFTIYNNDGNFDNTPVLIIGDFAGVENEFNCADLNAKNEFLSIVGENKKLFYENEKCNDVIDPIGKNFITTGGGSNDINEIKEALNGLPFNYGAIDEDFKKIKKLNKITELIELKKAIRFLRKAVGIDYQDDKEPLQLEDIEPIKNPVLINTLQSNWETVKTNINNGLQALQENKEKNEAEENKKKVREMLLKFFNKDENEKYYYSGNDPVLPKKGQILEYDKSQNQTKTQGIGPYYANTLALFLENYFRYLEKAFINYINENGNFKELFLKVCSNFTPEGYNTCSLYRKDRDKEMTNKENIYLRTRLNLNTDTSGIKYSIEKQKEKNQNQDLLVNYIFKILYDDKDKDLSNAFKSAKPVFEFGIKGKITILQMDSDNTRKWIKDTILDDYQKIWDDTIKIQLNTGSKTQEGVIFNEENPLQPILNQTVDNSEIFSFKNIKDIQENEPKYKEEKKFIDSLFVDKLEFVKDLEIYTYEQQQLANSVCTNRVTEGKFINNSLAEMRNMIRYVLQQKNKNMLDIVPNYINICLDKYCPNHKNCFSFETNEKDSEEQPVSIIFKQIELYFTNYARTKYKSNNEFNSEEFYNDLILSVFCVLNISKNANDPPKVPYIDINELKRIVYNYDIFMSEKDTIRGESAKKKKQMIKTNRTLLYSYASYLLNQIDSHYIQKIKTTEGDEPTETNVLEFIKTIDTKVSLNPQKASVKLLDYLTENPVQPKKLYDAFVFIINHLFPNKKPLYYDLHLKKQIEYKKDELSNKRKTINENINKTYELKVKIDEVRKKEKQEQQKQQQEAKKLQDTLTSLKDKGESVQEFTSYYHNIEYLNHFLNLELKRLQAAETALQNQVYNQPGYNHPGYNAKDFYEKTLTPYDRSNILNNDKDFETSLNAFENPHYSTVQIDIEYVYVTLKSYIHDTLNEINIDIVTKELLSLESREPQIRDEISPVCFYLPLINRYLKSDKSYTRYDAYNQSKMDELTRTIQFLKLLVNNLIPNLNEKIKEIKENLEEEFKVLETEYEDYILKGINSLEEGSDSDSSDSSQNIAKFQKEIKGFNEQSLKLQDEVIDLKEEIKKKENLLYFDIPTNEGNKDKTVYPSTDTIKKNQSQINNYPKHYMNILKLFLDEIDKYNAASAVGTLEFLDQISKLNTVSTICNFNENDMDTDEFAKKLHSDEIISLYKSNEIN